MPIRSIRSLLLAALAILAVPAAPLAAQDAAPVARIEVAVDRRVELLTLVARLAGFQEYNQPNSASPYATAAAAWCAPHLDHPLFARLKELRARRGVSFDALPSLAVHLTDSFTLDERVPFDAKPERLDARWQLDEVRELLELLRDFVLTADTEGFFDSRAATFAAAEERMRAVVARMKALPWFDAFFGARPAARYVAIPGLLCGGGNYGMGVRFADGTPEEILPIFGIHAWDAAGLPKLDAGMEGLFIHELCHTYTNPLVDRVAERLEAPLTRIHASCAEVMAKQAYGNWRTVGYESLVRACTIRARFVTEGKVAASQQAVEESARGFTWVPALAEELARFEQDRAQWPRFEDFLPEIVAYFERTAALVPPADGA